MKRLLLFTSWFLSSLLGHAEDQQKTIQQSVEVEVQQMLPDLFGNPALSDLFYKNTYGEVTLSNLSIRNQDLFDPMKGDTSDGQHFDVHLYQKGHFQNVYGQASYRRYIQHNIQWCNVKNPSLVWPYIVADSIKGTSFTEEYFFNGLWNRQFARFKIGMQANYLASESNRKLDPRAKTLTWDLQLKGGIAWNFDTNYSIASSIRWQQYEQAHHIIHMNPNTGSSIFYLQGLGQMDSGYQQVIQGGKTVANTYEINTTALYLQLFPRTYKGWFLNVGYEHQNLALLEANNRVVNTYLKKQYIASFGYKRDTKTEQWIWKLEARYHKKTGSEYERNPSDEVINIMPRYDDNQGYLLSHLLWEQRANAWHHIHQWRAKLQYNHMNYTAWMAKEKHRKKTRSVEVEFQEGAETKHKKKTIQLKGGVIYRHPLRHSISNYDQNTAIFRQLVDPIYRLETSPNFSSSLQVKVAFPTSPKQMWYVSSKIQSTWYKNYQPNYLYQVMIGMVL
ncbi:hypothetical protein K4L44_05275 [Halosquirtibacter laminarini]|uniref:Uncharacterized protein n=1 Tax=Halosquirtibacter laminarini TaxID=3374600 RepID=A0AC61NHV5_9BACT|nr:hypothetical protein K4L44_05275 [Prolixibacteraceae bacterium]